MPVALRRMCRQTLILRTAAIPEPNRWQNAAVYFPMLKAKDRQLRDLSRLGLPHQGVTTEGFEPHAGYGNWFWGLTPSCLVSLWVTARFNVVQRATEAFAPTVICEVVGVPFAHCLPDETEARWMAEVISATDAARPA